MGASWRNFLIQGEYYAINMNQAKNPPTHQPSLAFNGGYVEAGWVITGEPIRYSVGDAAFARPKVDQPWTLDGPSIGAWELALRYSVTNLNSNVIPDVSQTVTGAIYGGLQKIVGLNLSWYPNDWIRFYLQFQYTNVDKLNAAGAVSKLARVSRPFPAVCRLLSEASKRSLAPTNGCLAAGSPSYTKPGRSPAGTSDRLT